MMKVIRFNGDNEVDKNMWALAASVLNFSDPQTGRALVPVGTGSRLLQVSSLARLFESTGEDGEPGMRRLASGKHVKYVEAEAVKLLVEGFNSFASTYLTASMIKSVERFKEVFEDAQEITPEDMEKLLEDKQEDAETPTG